MAITTTQAQGLVLALFGASAGGHLTGLAAASNLNTLAGDLSTSAGLILGKDLSSNTAFRDHVTANLKLSGDALTAANAWLDGQLNAGAARGDIIATAVTFLSTLTDTTSPFYASAQAFQTTVTAAVAWSTGAGATQFGVSALRAQQGNVDVVAGSTFTLTVNTDVISGTAGNDTISGTTSRLGSADVLIDTNAADNDSLTMTAMSANVGATVIAGIENLNFNTSIVGGTTFTVDGTNMTGVTAMNIARGDLLDGQVSGKGDVTVNPIKGAQVKAVNITGVGTGATTVTQSTTGGTSVTTDGSGAVTLTGGGTVNAANSTGTVKVIASTTAAMAAANTIVNADKSTAVDLDDNAFTGSVTINAAKSTNTDLALGTGNTGATVTSGTDIAAGTSYTIDVTGISSAGATITTGAGGSKSATTLTTVGSVTAGATITLGGTSATTDAATIKGNGYIALAVGSTPVDVVTLSGNGAAVDYTVTNAFTSLTKSGADSVTVRANADLLTAKTVSGVDSVIITAITTAAAQDYSKIAAPIIVGADLNQNTTVASGAALTVAVDQTATTLYSKTDKGTVSLSTGDDTTDNTAATIALGATAFGTTSQTFTDVAINATTAALSMTSLDAGKANVVITGSKAVSITGAYSTTADSAVASTTKATAIDASGATGALTINVGADLVTLNTGTGADKITIDDRATATANNKTNFADNGTVVYTVNAGAGNNEVTLTSLGSGSQIYTGAGLDTVTIGHVAAALVSTGAGNDGITIAHNIDSDAIIAAGEGTDTLTLSDTDGNNFNNTNFAFTGVENINISALTGGAITINSAQLAANATFTLTGNSSADNLTVVGKSATVGNTVDASGITVSSASVTLQGNAKNDTITGTGSSDTINQTLGSDTVAGGAGTADKFVSITLDSGVKDSTAVGAEDIAGQVFNFGASAVTASQVATKLGTYLSLGIASVETGKTAYTFASEKAANSTAQQTISTVESFVGTSGKDYFVASDAGMTFEGGAGADYLALGGAKDTVVYSASSNGEDTVVGFTVGTGGDVLDFSKFVTIAGTLEAAGVAGSGALAKTTAGAAVGGTDIAGKLLIWGGTISQFQTALEDSTANNKLYLANEAKAVVLVGDPANGAQTYSVYYVVGDSGTTADLEAVTLVGTVAVNDGDAVDVANFLITA